MKKILMLVVSLVIVLSNYSICIPVKGIVFGRDDSGGKLPLVSASVTVLNSKVGTMTDKEGKFEIDLKLPEYIVVSYIGFEKDTIFIENSNNIVEIVLEPGLSSDEVIVEAAKPDYFVEKASPVKTEVITASGLKKAACCNLSESFVTNPTIDVTYSDAVTGVKQIQLLGLAQNYTQLMVEAVPNLQGLASNYGLIFIPGVWMNSISISKGTASVTRGYESITGQINIELKGPNSTEDFVFNNYLNDILRLEGNVVYRIKLGENLYLTNFIHGNYFNKLVDHNGDNFLDLPLNRQLNFLERIDFSIRNFESRTLIHTLINNSKSGQIQYFKNPDFGEYWGSNVDLQRFTFTTKNGYVFDGNRNTSIGTIISLTHHKQNSSFGKRIYNAEQNSLFATFLWSSSVDLFSNVDRSEYGEQKSALNFTFGFSYSFNRYIQYLDGVDLTELESVPGIITEFTYNPLRKLQIILGTRVDFHNKASRLFTPRIHLKYTIDDNNTFRLSFGKGYHFPLPISENQNILVSSREIIFSKDLKMEEAWNFGVNSTNNFEFLGRYFELNLEYYYTKFVNQTIIDRDSSPDKIFIYNLNGQSYSNSFQISLNFDLSSNLSFLTAYRLNDVWMTTSGKLQRKPLMSPSKAFLNVAYKPDPFAFDFTIEFNGGGRIPNTESKPENYRLSDKFKPFFILYGQVTYRVGNFEIYFGAENIGNFRQTKPILGYDAPFSNYFDGSMVWGPIDGRKVYLGLRFN
ncbi:MAG: TonB-dependent receptor [Candidatus Kapaibacteriota bacterium]|jgi:hypothetical protein